MPPSTPVALSYVELPTMKFGFRKLKDIVMMLPILSPSVAPIIEFVCWADYAGVITKVRRHPMPR